MGMLAIVAIGGNSLIKDKEHQTVPDQYEAVKETAHHIVDLVEQGYSTVVTHGNGPQVGFILRRSELAHEAADMHIVPLVSCVADTQGAIGYQLQQALNNEFKKRNVKKHAVTVVTLVEVDRDDPAFSNPAKPIGSFFTKKQITSIKKKHPEWHIMYDSGRGYRRVVPSPLPKKILETDAIKALVKQGLCVIGAGGGGIPVYRNQNGDLEGVDAVIDKDMASSLLASQLKADIFVISTAVDRVYLDYSKSNARPLDKMTTEQARSFIDEGHFAPGSMLPKIKAVLDFLDKGGKEAIITSPEQLTGAIKGEGGTHIYPS
ncbi:MAG: carbamate kinase [Spirochaetota bacterium]|nr:MAG: carbamate kinase [Spirochaetota bacterium]